MSLYIIRNSKKNIVCRKKEFYRTKIKQGIGLQFRRKINDEAHIFIFNKARKVPLTMWFVFFPIDVLYLDKNKKIVEIVENFRPFTNYFPNHESNYVIELPIGTIEQYNLKLSEKMDF